MLETIPTYAHHVFRPLDTDSDWRDLSVWNGQAADTKERRRALIEGNPATFDLDTYAHISIRVKAFTNLDWLFVMDNPAPSPWADPPFNVWVLTRVRNQDEADERIPKLLEIQAVVRGVIVEGLSDPVNLAEIWWQGWRWNLLSGECSYCGVSGGPDNLANRVNWVILSGGIGSSDASCDLAVVRDLIRQGQEAGVAVWVDRLGSNLRGFTDASGLNQDRIADILGSIYRTPHSTTGSDLAEWPEDARMRELPKPDVEAVGTSAI